MKIGEYSNVINYCKEVIRTPETIAYVKLCGGAITFEITDDMDYKIPTEEQRENLKKTFGIEVELIDDYVKS